MPAIRLQLTSDFIGCDPRTTPGNPSNIDYFLKCWEKVFLEPRTRSPLDVPWRRPVQAVQPLLQRREDLWVLHHLHGELTGWKKRRDVAVKCNRRASRAADEHKRALAIWSRGADVKNTNVTAWVLFFFLRRKRLQVARAWWGHLHHAWLTLLKLQEFTVH